MAENYRDPGLSPEKRAELLLQEMNLDEKMGQVNCLFPFAPGFRDFPSHVRFSASLNRRIVRICKRNLTLCVANPASETL